MAATRDVVVTVPKQVWLDWIDEGDLPGDPWSGRLWDFYLSWRRGMPIPPCLHGDRVYVVSHGRLRGFSPLLYVEFPQRGGICLVRRDDAVAVTIDEPVEGFRGWKRRWWSRRKERPFPGWQTDDVDLPRKTWRAWYASRQATLFRPDEAVKKPGGYV